MDLKLFIKKCEGLQGKWLQCFSYIFVYIFAQP